MMVYKIRLVEKKSGVIFENDHIEEHSAKEACRKFALDVAPAKSLNDFTVSLLLRVGRVTTL